MFKFFIAFLGLTLISIGLIVMLLGFMSFNEIAMSELTIMIVLSICLFIIGWLSIKPMIKIRRHKEDAEFKKILRL